MSRLGPALNHVGAGTHPHIDSVENRTGARGRATMIVARPFVPDQIAPDQIRSMIVAGASAPPAHMVMSAV